MASLAQHVHDECTVFGHCSSSSSPHCPVAVTASPSRCRHRSLPPHMLQPLLLREAPPRAPQSLTPTITASSTSTCRCQATPPLPYYFQPPPPQAPLLLHCQPPQPAYATAALRDHVHASCYTATVSRDHFCSICSRCTMWLPLVVSPVCMCLYVLQLNCHATTSAQPIATATAPCATVPSHLPLLRRHCHHRILPLGHDIPAASPLPRSNSCPSPAELPHLPCCAQTVATIVPPLPSYRISFPALKQPS